MNSTAQPRRILMTADTVGGVWTYALELARGLASYGIEIILATMGRRPSRQQHAELALLPNVELCESTFKLEWMPEPWPDVEAAGEWLLGLEKRYEPDLLHLNGYTHAALPWRAPKVVVGHSCVVSWWHAVHGREAPAEWNTYRTKVSTGLRAADLVVAPSAAMLSELELHYGPLGPSRVIHNGRRLTGLRLRPKEPFILSAGRLWDQAKNSAALAAMAPELPWPVYIAGDQANPAWLADGHDGDGQTRSIVGDGVQCSEVMAAHFLGRLAPAGLVPWFERAAIYSLPARYEPFGLSILEAAQAGCALVLSELPSLREIWGDAAVFVSIADPDELKEALREVIASPLWRAELAHRARAVAEHYTPEAMSAGYLAAYNRLLTRSHASLAAPTFGWVDPANRAPGSPIGVRRGARRSRRRCGRRGLKVPGQAVVQ